MEGLSMTPKLLNRISNKEYQEKDKWKIDDIALGPANELLISGHNLETPNTYISMYKEDSGKYGNRPEFNKTFDQWQPVEQLVLFVEGSSIIGLEVESALRLFKIEDMSVLRTLWWKWPHTCVCFYRGKLYAASSSTNIVSVCNLDSEDQNNIILSDMRRDRVLEIVVVMEKIYVCTKIAGRALVFSMTGSKELEFKNATQSDAMATSISIHERTELVFVSWNNFKIQLYSQNTSRCLRAIDMTEMLHKILVTTENVLITLNASKCRVTVYDVGEAIKIGEFQNTILSSVKKKHWKTLMSNDEANLEVNTADLELRPKNWKSAPKQSKVENLRDTKELYMKQLEENDNLRRKYDQDVQQLNHDIDRSKKEKDGVTEELEKARSNLSSKEADLSFVQAKLDAARTERDGLRRTNEEKEEKCCSLTKQLVAEKKTTEELMHDIDRSEKKKDGVTEELENTRSNLSSKEPNLSDVQAKLDAARTESDDLRRMNVEKEEKCCRLTKQLESERKTTKELNDRIKDLEGMKTELKIQQKKLKINLEEEKQKVTRAEGSRVQVVTNLKIVEERNTKLEAEVTQLKERLSAKEKIAKELQTSSLKLNERIKDLEDMRPEQKKLKDNLEEEKVTREEGSRVQLNERIKYLEGIRTKLESEQKELKDNLEEEKRKVIHEERSRVQSSTAKHNDLMKSSLLQIRKVVDKSLHSINEHQIIQVNHLDPVQGKDNLERRTSSRRTGKISRFLPKMRRRYSREIKVTQVEKMQQEERGYSTDSTFDSQSTSGYETASEFEWEGTLKPGFAGKIQYDKPGIKTDPASDHESTSGYETASEFEWQRTLSFGSAANIKHDEPNYTSDSATDYEDARSNVFDDTSDTDTVKGGSDEEEFLDGLSKLEVRARVSVEGAHLKIAETGVSLFIPPGALSEEQIIHMKIIPQPCDAKSALKFECNSVVVVELLPNNCRFKCPVSLTLPHCLQLKEEYETNSIDVLISHHEEGFKPNWEILHDAKFYLWKENCTIYLHSFCWVTYEIHDTIVEAKRIKLYTAGKRIRLNDRIAEVEVGFYPDLPGSGKILELNKDMHLSQRKPYVFLKTGEEPLLINLHKVVPKEWNNSQPEENPKIIPFDSVSISEERSCPFVLERCGNDTDIPLCIFKVGQKGRNEVELTIRPDVLTA